MLSVAPLSFKVGPIGNLGLSRINLSMISLSLAKLAHVDIQLDHTIGALHLRRGLRAIQDLLTTTHSKLWLCKPWPIGKTSL